MVNMSAKFDEEAHNGLVSNMLTSLFLYLSVVTLNFDMWHPKSIGFILSPWLTCLPSSMKKHTVVKSLISCSQAYFYTCQWWPWPLTSKINRVHILTLASMCAKFDEEEHIRQITLYVYCDLDLWPVTSKINRVHSPTMANMSAKFVEEAHNGLVSITFTSLFSYMSIVTLTSDLQNQ